MLKTYHPVFCLLICGEVFERLTKCLSFSTKMIHFFHINQVLILVTHAYLHELAVISNMKFINLLMMLLKVEVFTLAIFLLSQCWSWNTTSLCSRSITFFDLYKWSPGKSNIKPKTVTQWHLTIFCSSWHKLFHRGSKSWTINTKRMVISVDNEF